MNTLVRPRDCKTPKGFSERHSSSEVRKISSLSGAIARYWDKKEFVEETI